MELSGEYRIPTSPQQTWDALNDPEVLKACIPGCRELERVSDTEFTAVVTSKVGPISATFRGNVLLQDLDPPRSYTLAGQGQGGAAGFARMKSRVTLADDAGATLLRYDAHADVGGKLAAVGSRLVQSVAKKNADDFFGAFAARLGGEPLAAAAAFGGGPGTSGEPTRPEPGASAPGVVAAEITAPPAAVATGDPGRAPGPAAAALEPSTAIAQSASSGWARAAAPALAPWVIALIASSCGVVLGFILGRFSV
jgi:uncharacterized protein